VVVHYLFLTSSKYLCYSYY